MRSVDGRRVDAVVVGAGVAGLVAARDLRAAGREVVVLEAAARVGGRLRSVDGLDLGATWFWGNEPRVRGLIAELGLAVHAQHIAGDAVMHVPGGARRIDGNPLDVPCGRLTAGMQAIPEAIVAELGPGVVRTGVAVTAIGVTDDGVTVSWEEGEVAARHVVLAVPPALAAHRIRFTPPLPAALHGLAAATPVWMGPVVKVVVRYARPFWRDAGLAGAGVSHTGPLREVHDMSGPDGRPAALFGFAMPGPDEPAPAPEHVLHQLSQMFGRAALDAEAVLVQDWRREPFISPPGVERLTEHGLFGHPAFREPLLDGRLHWASTETAAAFAGHVEGAIVAGARAALAAMAGSVSAST